MLERLWILNTSCTSMLNIELIAKVHALQPPYSPLLPTLDSLTTWLFMIKKRTRPQTRTRVPSPEPAEGFPGQEPNDESEDTSLPYIQRSQKSCPSPDTVYPRLADLLELRKLRKIKQGIESSKLIVGDAKKRRRHDVDDEGYVKQEAGGLRAGVEKPGTPIPEVEDP